MKKFLTVGLIIFILCVVFLPWMTMLAHAADGTMPGGLVPCGNGNDPCTLCHFIIGFHNLVTVMLKLLVVVALAGIFISGVMYILSAGDETMMTSAKNFIKASIIGFVVVLGAFLIVTVTMWALSVKTDSDGHKFAGIDQTSWFTFTCSTVSSGSTASTPAATNTTPTTAATPAIACGPNDVGECKSGLGSCPDGWTTSTGILTNPCAGITTQCCVKNGETTETCSNGEGKCFAGITACSSGYENVVGFCTALTSICCKPTTTQTTVATPAIACGINNVGECKPPSLTGCPDGWSGTVGNPANICAGGTVCCAKSGESAETCGGGVGKCFYGTTVCPDGQTTAIGLCSASPAACCRPN